MQALLRKDRKDPFVLTGQHIETVIGRMRASRRSSRAVLERNVFFMEKLTRRKLIKQASIGAGAVSLLATTAACASPNETQAAGTTTTHSATIPAEPLAVFVTDPTRGTLVIMRGNSEITLTNPTLAQSLLALQ